MSEISKEQHFTNLSKQMRYYKNEFPVADEYVLAYITKFTDVGIFCELVEYKKEAFLSFKDASSSRKLKNIKKQVLKHKNYILIATNIDTIKQFIDVDKRSIDKTEELHYTNLIQFYHRIFTIFIKCYIFQNPTCSIEDVYDFLDQTLWKIDPKEVKLNILTIHQDTENIKTRYHLNTELGEEILQKLLDNIPKPTIEYTIKLKINSISLHAVHDIAEIINIVSDKIDSPFTIVSPPVYTSKIIKEYVSETIKDQTKIDLEKTITECIEQNSKDRLFIILEDINCDIITK